MAALALLRNNAKMYVVVFVKPSQWDFVHNLNYNSITGELLVDYSFQIHYTLRHAFNKSFSGKEINLILTLMEIRLCQSTHSSLIFVITVENTHLSSPAEESSVPKMVHK